MTPASPVSTHPDFPQTKDTDLVVQSSDGVQFHLHIKNLSVHTGAFPTNEFFLASGSPGSGSRESELEITHLPESGVVLAILFGFVYPKKQPSLKNLEYDVMGPLAEAAEKYEVFSAMYACEVRLRELVPQYPAQILAHGVKHDYPDLIDAATPYYSRKSLTEISRVLPLNLVPAWCRYHDAWEQCFKDIFKIMTQPDISRSYGNGYWNFDIQDLKHVLEWQEIDDLTALRAAIEDVPTTVWGDCQRCQEPTSLLSKFPYVRIAKLANILGEKFDAVPPFTSFI